MSLLQSRARHWQRHLPGVEGLQIVDDIDEDNEGDLLPPEDNPEKDVNGDGEDGSGSFPGRKSGSGSRGKASGIRTAAAAGVEQKGRGKRAADGKQKGAQKKKPREAMDAVQKKQPGSTREGPGSRANEDSGVPAAGEGAGNQRGAAADAGTVLSAGSSGRRKAAHVGGSSRAGLSPRPHRNAAEAAKAAIKGDVEYEMEGLGGKGRKRSRKAEQQQQEEEDEDVEVTAEDLGNESEVGANGDRGGSGRNRHKMGDDGCDGEIDRPLGRRLCDLQQQEAGEELVDSGTAGGSMLEEEQQQGEEVFVSAAEGKGLIQGTAGEGEKDGDPASRVGTQMLLPGFDPDMRPSASP